MAITPIAAKSNNLASNNNDLARNTPNWRRSELKWHFVVQIAGKALGLPGPAPRPVHGTGLAKFIAARTGTLTGSAAPAAQHGQFTPEVLQDHFG